MKHFKHAKHNKIIFGGICGKQSPHEWKRRLPGTQDGEHFVLAAQLSHLFTGIALYCQEEHKTRPAGSRSL
jgi:hypothetical protein